MRPDYADGIYNLGDIYSCMGKTEEAIEWMGKAIEKRPDWPLYKCNRGKQYVKLEDWDSVTDFIKALDDFDDVYDTLETLEVGNGLS